MELSARKASTSAGVGGRPVRSSVTRRMSVALSASFDGCRPSFSSRSRMKASIGLRSHAAPSVFGTGGRCGGVKAQWPSHFAPCWIHRLSRSTWAADSGGFFDLGGGISPLASMCRKTW